MLSERISLSFSDEGCTGRLGSGCGSASLSSSAYSCSSSSSALSSPSLSSPSLSSPPLSAFCSLEVPTACLKPFRALSTSLLVAPANSASARASLTVAKRFSCTAWAALREAALFCLVS